MLLLLLSAHARASAPGARPALRYTRTLWQGQDGLPESIVQAAAQTRDGYLWIGTTGGLARFDGSQFLSFALWHHPAAAIAVNSVFSLLPAGDGSLWVGTEGGGLLRFHGGGAIDSYSGRQGLTDNFIRAMLEDDGGRLWAGSDNGLFRLIGARLQRVAVPARAEPLAVHAIAEDHLHRIWVGGSSLLMFDRGTPHAVALAGAYSQNRVKAITETADGTVWVGTVGGLQRLVHDRFVPVAELRGATVRTLRQTADGTLWIGTIGHGLWTYAGGQFAPVHAPGLLPSNTVLSLCEDADGQLWLGTQNGLVRLSRTPVTVVPLPGGSDPDFETITCDTDGDLWVAGSSVYRIHDDVAKPYSFAAIPGVPVRTLFRSSAGDLWVGTDGSGAYRLNGPGSPVHYRAPGELTNNFVRAFLQTSRGELWIATDQGLTRMGAHGTTRYGVGDGLVYFSTRSLLEDRNHDVWIGTDQGLSHWHAGAFVHDEATEALAQEKVWSMLEDAAGVLWFGTRDHGLFGYQNGKVAQVTVAQGLPRNSIYQILKDRQGRLWFSGPGGVYAITAAELDQRLAAGGVPEPLNVIAPAMPFGADGAQMYGGRQPSGCVDTRGRVWFPSSKGAVHVSASPVGAGGPPPVILGTPRVDGQPVPGSGSGSAWGQGLRLAARASRVELPFAALLLRPQESVSFRYKLEGFDSKWTTAGGLRTATYTNLPAGSYQFRVAAFLPGDPGRSSSAVLRFEKEPYLYQTWWFVLLCATALAAAALGVYQLRVQQIRSRFQAVLDERSRLAREMHDTVIQGCTSVSALLEAIASFRLVEQAAPRSDDLLGHARTQIRTTIDEAREAVWNLRHGDERSQDFAASLAAIAMQMTKETGTAVGAEVRGAPFALRESVAHELLMVVREAVYNAILHGKPSLVTIHSDFGRQWLTVRVEDDGGGFEPAALQESGTHYGITGMRERVERLGGRFTLISKPGAGTSVSLAVRRAVLVTRARRGTTA